MKCRRNARVSRIIKRELQGTLDLGLTDKKRDWNETHKVNGTDKKFTENPD
jgi:hypothetical protein